MVTKNSLEAGTADEMATESQTSLLKRDAACQQKSDQNNDSHD